MGSKKGETPDFSKIKGLLTPLRTRGEAFRGEAASSTPRLGGQSRGKRVWTEFRWNFGESPYLDVGVRPT